MERQASGDSLIAWILLTLDPSLLLKRKGVGRATDRLLKSWMNERLAREYCCLTEAEKGDLLRLASEAAIGPHIWFWWLQYPEADSDVRPSWGELRAAIRSGIDCLDLIDRIRLRAPTPRSAGQADPVRADVKP
jgi:hypothetical protein